MSSDQKAPETTDRQEFGKSLRLLDHSAFGVLWSAILALLLLPGAVVLLQGTWPVVRVGSTRQLDVRLVAFGLLGLLWLLNILALHRYSQLREFRKHILEQMHAATKQRVRAEKYYGMSILDPLTGLYNRRFGETRLREEIERAEKSGEPLLVLALDFDRFKEINDSYGHAGGDLALKTFSRKLQRAIRACDVPIRVGGDEFLLILPECSQDKVDMILSRMHPIKVSLDGQTFQVSFSHGLAQYQVSDTPDSIIRRADERLYAEKANRASVEA